MKYLFVALLVSMGSCAYSQSFLQLSYGQAAMLNKPLSSDPKLVAESRNGYFFAFDYGNTIDDIITVSWGITYINSTNVFDYRYNNFPSFNPSSSLITMNNHILQTTMNVDGRFNMLAHKMYLTAGGNYNCLFISEGCGGYSGQMTGYVTRGPDKTPHQLGLSLGMEYQISKRFVVGAKATHWWVLKNQKLTDVYYNTEAGPQMGTIKQAGRIVTAGVYLRLFIHKNKTADEVTESH